MVFVFLSNGLISLYTTMFSSMKVWMLYNGFIAYFAIATMITAELIIRFFVKRKYKNDSL